MYLPATTGGSSLSWNYNEIFDILSENSVVCYISGHDHDCGYSVDQRGIHHITMPGAIENPESYAVGMLLEDSLVIKGRGDMIDVNCSLRFKMQCWLNVFLDLDFDLILFFKLLCITLNNVYHKELVQLTVVIQTMSVY